MRLSWTPWRRPMTEGPKSACLRQLCLFSLAFSASCILDSLHLRKIVPWNTSTHNISWHSWVRYTEHLLSKVVPASGFCWVTSSKSILYMSTGNSAKVILCSGREKIQYSKIFSFLMLLKKKKLELRGILFFKWLGTIFKWGWVVFVWGF